MSDTTINSNTPSLAPTRRESEVVKQSSLSTDNKDPADGVTSSRARKVLSAIGAACKGVGEVVLKAILHPEAKDYAATAFALTGVLLGTSILSAGAAIPIFIAAGAVFAVSAVSSAVHAAKEVQAQGGTEQEMWKAVGVDVAKSLAIAALATVFAAAPW